MAKHRNAKNRPEPDQNRPNEPEVGMNDEELEVVDLRTKDVRAVRAELEKVRTENEEGLLVPSAVVDVAADPDNPLHSYFTWDDSEAAKKWRLVQARALIREIEVTLPEDVNENPIPRYVSLVSDRKRPGGGYRQTRQVLQNKELLAELEATARVELESWTRRFQMLHELTERVRAAAKLEEKKPPTKLAPKKPKKK